MIDTLHETAGLEDQLGCSGVTLLTLAFTAGLIKLTSRLLVPKASAFQS